MLLLTRQNQANAKTIANTRPNSNSATMHRDYEFGDLDNRVALFR
jgi:hypothetical protein